MEDKVVQFMSCICPEEKDVIQEPPPKFPRDEDGAGCHHGLLQPSHEEVGQRRCHGRGHNCSKYIYVYICCCLFCDHYGDVLYNHLSLLLTNSLSLSMIIAQLGSLIHFFTITADRYNIITRHAQS